MIMKRLNLVDKVFLLVFICLAILLFTGIQSIPFHPDEVSLLYQSRDLERLFSNPIELAYQPDREGEIDQTYRALNPPLPKYILALGRLAAGYGSDRVSVDWNWSLTWDENKAAGALFSTAILSASRIASTIMVLLSLPILYLCGKRIRNSVMAMSAVLLLGTHSLVLLHGRRAMAEGTLIFGVSLAILGILEGDKRPWLAGIGTAIAACSKLSALALAPVGLLSVLWLPTNLKNRKTKLIRNATLFIVTFLALFLLLNPFLWSNPIKGIQSQWHERTQFLQGMVEEIEARSPDQILHGPLERFAVMVTHLFIAEPQFAEAGNYISNTSNVDSLYLSRQLHTLFRGWPGGILMISLTIMGVVIFGIEGSKVRFHNQRPIMLLLIASTIQTVAIIWANPFPFQRYYIPLIPFICLWIGYFMAQILAGIKQATSRMK
jgi:4-amino-4-deoxy-L-arabinose transferase-like glycosyltransferase